MYDLVVIRRGVGRLRVATAAARAVPGCLGREEAVGGRGYARGLRAEQRAGAGREARPPGPLGRIIRAEDGNGGRGFPRRDEIRAIGRGGFRRRESDELLRAEGIDIYHGSAAFSGL